MNKKYGKIGAFTKESLSKQKPRPGLIEPEFLLSMAEVLAFGAAKYAKDNWKLCTKENIDLYWDAHDRHVLAYKMGEKIDHETKICHLAHAACNLMFIQHIMNRSSKQEARIKELNEK